MCQNEHWIQTYILSFFKFFVDNNNNNNDNIMQYNNWIYWDSQFCLIPPVYYHLSFLFKASERKHVRILSLTIRCQSHCRLLLMLEKDGRYCHECQSQYLMSKKKKPKICLLFQKWFPVLLLQSDSVSFFNNTKRRPTTGLSPFSTVDL